MSPCSRRDSAEYLALNASAAPKKKAKKEEVKAGPPKKIDALMDLIRKHPTDKLLVFSRYENPFRSMHEKLQEMNVKVETVKGN
jgi:superfamily II DNA/RNA helicase